jgi:hypothetical protein
MITRLSEATPVSWDRSSPRRSTAIGAAVEFGLPQIALDTLLRAEQQTVPVHVRVGGSEPLEYRPLLGQRDQLAHAFGNGFTGFPVYAEYRDGHAARDGGCLVSPAVGHAADDALAGVQHDRMPDRVSL